jgi:hypothetical protein
VVARYLARFQAMQTVVCIARVFWRYSIKRTCIGRAHARRKARPRRDVLIDDFNPRLRAQSRAIALESPQCCGSYKHRYMVFFQ